MYLSVNSQPKIYNTQFNGKVSNKVKSEISEAVVEDMTRYVEDANRRGRHVQSSALQKIKKNGQDILKALEDFMGKFDDKIELKELKLELNDANLGGDTKNANILPIFCYKSTSADYYSDSIYSYNNYTCLQCINQVVERIITEFEPSQITEGLKDSVINIINELILKKGVNIQSFNKYINAFKHLAKITGESQKKIEASVASFRQNRETVMENNRLLKQYSKNVMKSEK